LGFEKWAVVGLQGRIRIVCTFTYGLILNRPAIVQRSMIHLQIRRWNGHFFFAFIFLEMKQKHKENLPRFQKKEKNASEPAPPFSLPPPTSDAEIGKLFSMR
jgi:hypothetical protein